MSADTDEIRGLIAELRAQLADAQHVANLALQRVTVLEHPMSQPVFLAKADGGGFQERTTENGSTFRDFTDGRSSTAAPMTLEAGAKVLLVIPGVGTEYYVEINNAVPAPWARNIYLISKEDPDNPGSFIWESNDGRFRQT